VTVFAAIEVLTSLTIEVTVAFAPAVTANGRVIVSVVFVPSIEAAGTETGTLAGQNAITLPVIDDPALLVS
jgi:hypothetical protein